VDALRGNGPFVRWEGIAGFGLKGGESMAVSFRTVGGGFGVYVLVLLNDD
jgi:hypothetical protein